MFTHTFFQYFSNILCHLQLINNSVCPSVYHLLLTTNTYKGFECLSLFVQDIPFKLYLLLRKLIGNRSSDMKIHRLVRKEISIVFHFVQWKINAYNTMWPTYYNGVFETRSNDT